MTHQDDWLGFLERAVWGLRKAALRLCAEDTRGHFETKMGWWRKPIRIAGIDGVLIPEETAVSQALEHQFQSVVADQHISGLERGDLDLRHFHISTERRRSNDPGIGQKSKPTDIAIELSMSFVYDLRIEAKTILRRNDIKAEYLGSSGLLRFEDAQNPYTLERYGAMLAYVVNNNEATWENNLRAEVLAFVGSTRLENTVLLGRSMTTSVHRFTPTVGLEQSEVTVRVLHFALEIESSPSLRSL